MTDQTPPETAPKDETSQGEGPKQDKQAKKKKVRLIRLRATVPYYNGTIEWGLPPWRRGEERDVPLAALKQFNEDGPGIFEIVGEASDDES